MAHNDTDKADLSGFYLSIMLGKDVEKEQYLRAMEVSPLTLPLSPSPPPALFIHLTSPSTPSLVNDWLAGAGSVPQ